MAAETLTGRLAEAALALAAQPLPNEVLGLGGELLADLLLVAAAGQAEASSQALIAAAAAAPGPCQVWFATPAARRAPAEAAFANTLNAAALDYDSLNQAVHADLVTLPAAWAMAEYSGRTPLGMLQAFLIASEAVSRLSRGGTGPSKGWSGTSLYGGLGAALASGLLLGLDARELQHALGLAAAQAAGSQQGNLEHTLAKRLQPAFAVRNGVQSALLAQAGATAPQNALEGRFGLRALYQPGDDSALLSHWGTQWQVFDTALKRYPTCACGHAAIQALLDLQARVCFSADAVEAVTAFVSPFMHRLVGAPLKLTADLQVVAQFSLQYQLASVLLRGPFNLQHLLPDAVLAPAIASLAKRVNVQIDPANLHELAPASVRVRLADGRVLQQRCEQLPGGPAAPLSSAQRAAKARECGLHARPAISGTAVQAMARGLAARPGLPDLLTSGLEQ
ncbi:MmgE/PrpD family protein [Pseudomonas sp. NPDC007930]|uniref:MmgE/PrpD family protein n=1 Tax=Pseudomonas sp. NPDC007930 TaxID=3364417 RepID=UPI0036E9F04D